MPRSLQPDNRCLCGAGNLACSRLSGGPCTRPTEIPHRSNQPRTYRVIFNVRTNALELSFIPYQMVIAFILPESLPHAPQNQICLMRRVPLQRPQPPDRIHMRRHQHVHMVRHHHEGMQVVPMEPLVAISQRGNDHPGHIGSLEIMRTYSGSIEKPVDRDESFSGGNSSRRKNALRRQTPKQPESHEERMTNYRPVREAAFVVGHKGECSPSPEDLKKVVPGRLKGGCGQDCPPHIAL